MKNIKLGFLITIGFIAHMTHSNFQLDEIMNDTNHDVILTKNIMTLENNNTLDIIGYDEKNAQKSTIFHLT